MSKSDSRAVLLAAGKQQSFLMYVCVCERDYFVTKRLGDSLTLVSTYSCFGYLTLEPGKSVAWARLFFSFLKIRLEQVQTSQIENEKNNMAPYNCPVCA